MSFQLDTSLYGRHHILPLSSRARIQTFCVWLAILPFFFFMGMGKAQAAGGGFWAHYGDGKAEVAGYALRFLRYGEPRDGRLVLIFVTEDLSDSARVKADPGRHPLSDVYPVLKLNALRKFQTGIYDYSTMTSVFVRIDTSRPGGGPLRKISFSSQEWCGQVYHQLLPLPAARLASTSHSYFDGEADEQQTLEWPDGTLGEDELPVRLRSYPGQPDLLAPGERRTLKLGASLLRVRLLHQPFAIGEATIERQAHRETWKTPAGTFAVFTYAISVAYPGHRDRATFHLEAAPPHRLVHYRWESGEEATLLGSARLPYWQLNKNGQEALLNQLGLQPVPPAKVAPSSNPALPPRPR